MEWRKILLGHIADDIILHYSERAICNIVYLYLLILAESFTWHVFVEERGLDESFFFKWLRQNFIFQESSDRLVELIF